MVLTCSKSGPATKEEGSALAWPKPELNKEEKVTLTSSKLESLRKKDASNFRFQAFKILFSVFRKFHSCATVFMPWIHSKLDYLILV